MPHGVRTFAGACSRQVRRNSMTARSISSVSTGLAKRAGGNEVCARTWYFRGPRPNPYIGQPPTMGRGEKQTRLRNVTSVKEELAPHVHDITRALGDKVSEQEIERELSSYLNVYRVSLDTAKRSIVKKHGGNPGSLAVGVSKTIRELVPGEQSVNLLVRVVAVYEKEVTPQGQEAKRILSGILGDPTATVPFTGWEPLPMPLAKGDVIRVQNAYTKEYRGQVQVNFGVRTVVGKEAPDALPEYKPAAGLPYAGKPTPVRVVDLREGASNVAVTARILSVERREVEVDGAPKAVFSGVLADETGKTQFSAWKDFGLKEDEVLRIEGAYVKSWRGIPQVSFDERATITRLKADLLPPRSQLRLSPRMWIEDLAERGGGADVTVRGILIDLREGSGLVYRCPECRRVLRKGACRIHGEVKGEPDLRVKAVLDDGSGALTAVFDRELTEALLDKTLDACIAQAKEAMSTDVVRDELADVIVAQPVEVRGNVTSDDYGLMMIVESAKILKVDVQAEAREMLEAWRVPHDARGRLAALRLGVQRREPRGRRRRGPRALVRRHAARGESEPHLRRRRDHGCRERRERHATDVACARLGSDRDVQRLRGPVPARSRGIPVKA